VAMFVPDEQTDDMPAPPPAPPLYDPPVRVPTRSSAGAPLTAAAASPSSGGGSTGASTREASKGGPLLNSAASYFRSIPSPPVSPPPFPSDAKQTGGDNSGGPTTSTSSEPARPPRRRGDILQHYEQQLTRDFATEFAALTAMGFTKEDALEAIVVCGHNKKQQQQQPDSTQQQQPLRKRPLTAAAAVAGDAAKSGGDNLYERLAEYALADASRQQGIRLAELEKRSRYMLRDHQEEVSRLAQDHTNRVADLQSEALQNFLSVLLCDTSLGVTEEELAAVEEKREAAGVSRIKLKKLLRNVGVSDTRLQAMLTTGSQRSQKSAQSSLCIGCRLRRPDHLVRPCSHLVLCEDCAPRYRLPGSRCLRCTRRISSVVKLNL